MNNQQTEQASQILKEANECEEVETETPLTHTLPNGSVGATTKG